MNQKLKPASRLSVVFILVVVLSGSILTWFSINNISNQKVLTEKRIQEEQRELSARFSDVLQKQIENVTAGFSNEISSINVLKDSLNKKASENDFISQPFIIKNSGGFLYPNFTGISDNIIKPKFSSRFKSTFNEGEKAEFTENNLKAAREKYLQCLQISSAKIDSAKALNAVGRVSIKLKEYENAIQQYNLICHNYYDISDENGVPYIYYAVPQLLKITTTDNFEKQLPVFESIFEKMGKGEIPLNFNSKDWLTKSVKSLQELSLENPGKLENIKVLEKHILQQLQFVDEYKNEMSELLKKVNLNNHSNMGNDFRVVNSPSGNGQILLLINTNYANPAGFLIEGEKLFATVTKTELQSGFEFDYNIEFATGYRSNSTKNSLLYSSQLNPYFPEQQLQIKLSDENVINDFIHRRSWIYGISTVLLLVAMVLGVVLIVRDISGEKHLARLQSDFISNVTHELKTPLTSISIFAESMLLKRVKKDSDKEEYLSIILKESERLKRMVNNILEFSKLEKGKSDYQFVNSNLASLVTTAIHEFDYWFEKEGFEVITELDNKIEAKVDPEKMKQVFENLLNNAIKYSTTTKKIITRLYVNTSSIHIEIEDQGIGIAENEISKIFEKFYRINHRESISGTGLGLTVVNEIVQAHEGKIEVASEVGKGSKFSIILLQQKAERVKNILIIEDDISILRGLKDNLEYEGYSVLTETDGRKGLEKARGKNADLILLDIMLPGINGFEICRKVKKEKPELPIIMITARGSEMDKVSGLDIGADDYITKPFSIPELLARVRAVLRRFKNETEFLQQYTFGEIKLDFIKYQAFRNNQEISLSSKEFDILKYLIEHEGEAIHRHDLLNEVWGYESMPTTRTVDNFILDLRKKLEEDPSNPRHILGVRGVGYKFNA